VVRLLSQGTVESATDLDPLSRRDLADLVAAGLLDYRDDGVICALRARVVQGLVIFSDPDLPEMCRPELYLDPLWEAPLLARLLTPGQVASGFDMGCGSGLLSLLLAERCDLVEGVDVNPRAVAIARVNAALNGIRNVRFYESDLFSSAGQRRFDRIVFNSPTFHEQGEFHSLLQSGESILKRFFEQLPGHLTAAGVCQINLAANDYPHSSFSQRLRQWLADDTERFDRLLLIKGVRIMGTRRIWKHGLLTIKAGHGHHIEVPWPYGEILRTVPIHESSALSDRILNNNVRLKTEDLRLDQLAWHQGASLSEFGSHLSWWGQPLVKVDPEGLWWLENGGAAPVTSLPVAVTHWLHRAVYLGLLDVVI
jgi:SAM-dependent methyltransferase